MPFGAAPNGMAQPPRPKADHMKKPVSRLIELLRDPAVQTIVAIVGLLVLVWGAISGRFANVIALLTSTVPWLSASRAWPNWISASVVIITLVLFVAWLRGGLLRPKPKLPRPQPRINYRKVWGVLWGWPPPAGRFIAAGPLCPDHKLPMDVKKVEKSRSCSRYDFHCPGPEGHEGHSIEGPKFTQLVPEGGWGNSDPNIYKDVNARLRAEEIAASAQQHSSPL